MKIKIPKLISLKNILSEKNSLFKRILRPEVYTCLEISEAHIKLAQFEFSQDGRELIYLITRKIPSQEEEDIIKTLRVMLTALKVKGTLTSCIARQQVTVRYIKMPSSKAEELKSMLDFQVTKQIPYPKEETVYSYSVLDIDNNGYADVMLAIVHQPTISKHLRIIQKSGIETENVSFNSLASCRWLLSVFGQVLDPTLLIDVDSIYTNISVVDSKGLLFTRAIKIGENDFSSQDSRRYIEQLNEEIRLSLSVYDKEVSAASITKFILTGASANLDKIKDLLEREFEFEVEVKLALENIKVRHNVPEENWFDMHNASLTAVLGLGLEKTAPFGLNLLPDSAKESKARRQRHNELIFSLILSGLIFLTAVGFITKKFYDKTQVLQSLRQEIEKVSSQAEVLEGYKRNLELAQDLFSDRGISLQIILELHKIVPSQINLTNFDFEDKKGLTIKGTSNTMAEVFRFITILDGSPYFNNPRVRFVKKRAGRENLTDFEIFCPLRNKSEVNK